VYKRQQRAENSSTWMGAVFLATQRQFQCSSASRKFLNRCALPRSAAVRTFQCSSASRKFLKEVAAAVKAQNVGFSALQRAENSSIFNENDPARSLNVSVLFSEPKIPQTFDSRVVQSRSCVSVLFSEPKIPQPHLTQVVAAAAEFQCSSASRKFLNTVKRLAASTTDWFQCSSASRKFLNAASVRGLRALG